MPRSQSMREQAIVRLQHTCPKQGWHLLMWVMICLLAWAASPQNAGAAPNGAANQAPGPRAPRVAVFAQAGFPSYMISPFTSPQNIAASLNRTGIKADLLDVSALSDPQRFNVNRYAALILAYGNAYPQAAFANMRAFHQAGGSLIVSAIPFTHAVARVSVASWEAHPSWGTHVQTVADAHAGAQSVELTGSNGEWVGINSAKFPVHPGDQIAVSAWGKEVSGTNEGDDWVYLRFFGPGGTFISQHGAEITSGPDWHHLEANITAPPRATTFDVSPQMRSATRKVRLDDLQVSVNGHTIPLANGNFETPGNDWADLGHSSTTALFGPEGIGIGGFGESSQGGPVAIAPGDPLDLASLHPDWKGTANIQWLDAATLPAGDRVLPALTVGGKPTAAIIVHNDATFPGAVDVWTHHAAGSDLDAYLVEQMLARGAVAALSIKGLLTPTQQKAAFVALNQAPKPPVYANLTLPSPRRPYPTFQPKMPPPARHLYVADARLLKSDERILLISLQGIVNRKQPRIYLLLNDEDLFWLKEMQRQGATDSTIPVADPLSLVSRFRTSINGAVVSDPKVYDSPDIAASIAGADDLVMATPALAAKLHLPIKTDLRGKFKNNVEALRYLRTKVFPRLNPYLAICLDPPLLDNGSIDQIIAARGIAFWMTGIKAQGLPGANMAGEVAETKELLARMPLNAVVRGFWWHGDGWGIDEGPGVSLGSRFGKVTVVSDYVSNFSVFSGVPAQNLKQKPRPPAPKLDPSKVYVALTMSDGDNLSTWRSYFRDYFNNPLHGSFPMGWGMGPSIIDNNPVWARWYYEHAGPNDEFICDVSGVGYMYPSDWATSLKDRDAATHSFYRWTQTYMNRLDMRTVRLMNVAAADISRVAPDLARTKFLMPDYGYSGEHTYPEFTYTLPTGQPVFRAITPAEGGAQHLADLVRQRVGTIRPAFANVFIWNWGSKPADIKQMLNLLGPEYVPVTPSQLYELYKQAHPTAVAKR